MFSTKDGEKSTGMTRHMRMLPVFLAAVVVLILAVSAPVGRAQDSDEIPFDVANIFFELNDTDGDLGIHALIDGEAWKELEIEDFRGLKMLDIEVKSRLKRQGLTEIFFESAEPSFDELPPEKFFRRFPEGEYEIKGTTLEGDDLESTVELTHVMPAPAGAITVNDIPARPLDPEVDCDEEDPPVDRTVSGDVVIAWDPVTSSHPDIGESDPDIEIIRYQVVAEWEDEDENVFVSSVDLPTPDPNALPARMSVKISEDFFRAGTEFKVEVLVREASFNQTAVESCPFEYNN